MPNKHRFNEFKRVDGVDGCFVNRRFQEGTGSQQVLDEGRAINQTAGLK